MAENFLGVVAGRIVDYLFPALCIMCDMPRPAGNRWLCEKCRNSLLENNQGRDPCPRCAMNRKRGPCACHREWEHPFESVYSILDFDASAKLIMHQVKYRGMKRFAYYIGALLAEGIPKNILHDCDVLVPVPLHPKREKERGYNQSALLAEGIVSVVNAAPPMFGGALRRVRNTASQTKLDREQRKKNMEAAFAIAPEEKDKISSKKILLFDDIVTTGATTASAAKALLDAGCSSVRVLSLARD